MATKRVERQRPETQRLKIQTKWANNLAHTFSLHWKTETTTHKVDNKKELVKSDLTTLEIKVNLRREFDIITVSYKKVKYKRGLIIRNCTTIRHPNNRKVKQVQDTVQNRLNIIMENQGNHGQTYKCPECPYTFHSEETRDRHRIYRHGYGGKYECELCYKKLTTRQNLKIHMDIHRDERKFRCPVCTKGFNVKRTMLQHVRAVHNKEKPVSCEICARAFGVRGNLTRHMATVHATEKNFRCNLCPKAYKLKHHLDAHVKRIHEKEEAMKGAEGRGMIKQEIEQDAPNTKEPCEQETQGEPTIMELLGGVTAQEEAAAMTRFGTQVTQTGHKRPIQVYRHTPTPWNDMRDPMGECSRENFLFSH